MGKTKQKEPAILSLFPDFQLQNQYARPDFAKLPISRDRREPELKDKRWPELSDNQLRICEYY